MLTLTIKAFSRFLFPPLCLQCEERLEVDTHLFCPRCLEEWVPFDRESACPKCLSLFEGTACPLCLLYPSPFDHMTVSCEPAPAVSCLSNMAKRWEGAYGVKSVAALLTYSFLLQERPLPDLIIPFPTKAAFSLTSTFEERLSEELSLFLGRPVLKNSILRAFLDPHKMTIKQSASLSNRTLLLVGESFSPAFVEAGKALKNCFPKRLEGIVFIPK